MIIHIINPVAFDFQLFQIRWYSLAYILGIILGWVYASKIISLSQNNNYNYSSVKKSDFDNLIIYLVLGIVIGGRLGYVLFYNLNFFTNNFYEIFKIWNGGMSFHGGLLGVIISIFIFSKNYQINFFKLSDIIACVSPIGIFLGRIANFINGELYGKASSLPWSIIFPNGGNIARHPSQIYEAALEGLLLFIIINYFAFKKEKFFKPGYVSGYFLILYSILRMIGEIFREPDIHLGYLFNFFSMGILLSILSLLSGLLIILQIKKNEQVN